MLSFSRMREIMHRRAIGLKRLLRVRCRLPPPPPRRHQRRRVVATLGFQPSRCKGELASSLAPHDFRSQFVFIVLRFCVCTAAFQGKKALTRRRGGSSGPGGACVCVVCVARPEKMERDVRPGKKRSRPKEWCLCGLSASLLSCAEQQREGERKGREPQENG